MRKIPKIKVCHKSDEFSVLEAMMSKLNQVKVKHNCKLDDSVSMTMDNCNEDIAVASLISANEDSARRPLS